MRLRIQIPLTAGVLALAMLFSGFGIFKKKKYENPITKDTLQPDKVLFDRAVKDIEHGRYEIARLTLNTLINTYDTSEYLAKAKLAIADSWYREGGSHGLAQAEAEYKDFILFYPAMEEAAESQFRICGIHYKQMEIADRDSGQAQRTEDECREVLNKFPNSKFVKPAKDNLLRAQEVIAEKEFRTGVFYHTKGSFPAAANRLTYVTQQYPMFSQSDEALWQLADSYNRMGGDRFENQVAEAYTKIVRDYPLSKYVDESKSRLQAMKRPVPEPDAAAAKRMQADLDSRKKPGFVHNAMNLITGRPETYKASLNGDPVMKAMRPPIPVSVPKSAAGDEGTALGGGGVGVSDVTAGTVSDTQKFDASPDALKGNAAAKPAGSDATVKEGEKPAEAPKTDAAAAAQQPLPTNHTLPPTKKQKKIKEKKPAKSSTKVVDPKATDAPKTDTAKPDAAKPDAAKQ